MTQAVDEVIDRDARLAAALAGTSVDRLLEKFREFVVFGHTEADEHKALRVAGELDRRGIAPVFRLPHDPVHVLDPLARRIVALCDLQWLRARYPSQKAVWSSMRGVFSLDYEKAVKAWNFALWNGQRAPVHLVKGLGLSDSQVQELAWIIPAHVGKVRRVIHEQRTRVAERIADAVKEGRDRRGEADKAATVARRVVLWGCAMLADWKPKRTAELFAMTPSGEVLPRNIVGRHLEAITYATGRCNLKKTQKLRPQGT